MVSAAIDSFPLWIRISHFVNVLVIFILIRSGIQIFFDHPKLYWKDDAAPGSEWFKYTKKVMPKDRPWTSMDEVEKPPNSIVALPGGFHDLGSGRRWHFLAVIIWTANGLFYVTMLLVTGQWRRLVPTSLSVLSGSWETMKTYASLRLPPLSAFHPYDPLQQLAYAAIVFVVSPLMILTGIAQSPAIAARYPWYARMFGGRQAARSIHFICTFLLVAFTAVHLTLVVVARFPQNMGNIVLGSSTENLGLAMAIGIAAIAGVVLLNVWITVVTQRERSKVQKALDPIVEPVMQVLFGKLRSRQHYAKKDVSPFFRVNGLPPAGGEYERLRAGGFAEWRLRVGGMVERSASLSLADIKALPMRRQVTEHVCIQGWSAIAEWGGASFSEIIRLCRPSKDAKFVVFRAYDKDPGGRPYFETLSMEDVLDPQTILAYEMNEKPLPVEYGAPLRLRCEIKLGYKMVKFLESVEFIHDLKEVGDGSGGYKEMRENYEEIAAI